MPLTCSLTRMHTKTLQHSVPIIFKHKEQCSMDWYESILPWNSKPLPLWQSGIAALLKPLQRNSLWLNATDLFPKKDIHRTQWHSLPIIFKHNEQCTMDWYESTLPWNPKSLPLWQSGLDHWASLAVFQMTETCPASQWHYLPWNPKPLPFWQSGIDPLNLNPSTLI